MRAVVVAVLGATGGVHLVPAAMSMDARPPFVVAVLGDSYASGEGAPDVHGRHSLGGDLVAVECVAPPGCQSETWWSPDSWFSGRDAVFPQQDDQGWQNDARRCHRSTKGPANHAAMLIADRFPRVRVEVLNFACGGAKIVEGLVQPYAGAEPPLGSTPLAPQVNALEAYVKARGSASRVDAVVMNIGGNDAAFAPIVQECLNIFSDPFDTDCSDNPLMLQVSRIADDNNADPINFGEPDKTKITASLARRYATASASLAGTAGTAPGAQALGQARPKEVYLSALPNASHDALPADRPAINPDDFCDGTQTDDEFYKRASLGESAAIENAVKAMNGAMGRAAQRHGWVFLPEMFDEWRGHGICADGASFFRTNADALRIQGDEGIPLPNLSPGIAHPNEAGHASRAAMIADRLEEQVRMMFTPPAEMSLDSSGGGGFTISFTDTAPQSLEKRFELELDPPTGQTLRPASDIGGTGSGGVGVTFERVANRVIATVSRPGEFTVRARACRRSPVQPSAVATYCSPFSNAVDVSTDKPGAPTDLRRAFPQPADASAIRLTWTPGPNSANATYRLSFGKLGGSCTGTTLASCTITSQSGSVETTQTTQTVTPPTPGDWLFSIAACNSAGCSTRASLTETLPRQFISSGVVGTFNLAVPVILRTGRPATIEIAWRTPRRWTELGRVDLIVSDRGRKVGVVRFLQGDGVIQLIAAGKSPFGHPDSSATIRAGRLAVDLSKTSIVRFSPKSQRVVLRIGLVPGAALRGRTLELALAARDDRGRRQAERTAGRVLVR